MSDFNRRGFMAALSGLAASFCAGGMPEDAIATAGEDFFARMDDEVSSCSCAGPCCVGFSSTSNTRGNCPDFKFGVDK